MDVAVLSTTMRLATMSPTAVEVVQVRNVDTECMVADTSYLCKMNSVHSLLQLRLFLRLIPECV